MGINRSADFEVFDDEFEKLLGEDPRLVPVVETDAHEGPVYVPSEDSLYFTSLPIMEPDHGEPPLVAIKRFVVGTNWPLDPSVVEVVRPAANAANGMTLDGRGRLVVCEQGTLLSPARISRFDPKSGVVETVVDRLRSLPLNSPNDVVVKSDGTIWFTDPSYGHLQGFRPAPLNGDYVYRYDPITDRLAVVDDSFVKPNGLAFSPDERVLYVTDSGANREVGSFYPHLPHHIVAFDIIDGRRLGNRRLFAVSTPGFPDGIKVDRDGRVFASAASGVQAFNSSGDLIGEIKLPGAVNFTFGGRDQNILLITADTAVWAALLDTSAPAVETK